MSENSDEINDNLDRFLDFILRPNSSKTNNDLLLLINTLNDELKTCRENLSVLQRNFNMLVVNDKTHVDKQFVLLREQYDKLEIENVELKEQINKLKDQLKVDLEYHKSVFIKNMKDLKEMSEAELETLRQKYENSKIESQNRESELYIKLQAIEASKDFQRDEIESTLKEQLVDSSNKLRNSQNFIRKQQMEIANLKAQLMSYEQQRHTNSKHSEETVLCFEQTPIQKAKHLILQNTFTRQLSLYDNEQEEYSQCGSSGPSLIFAGTTNIAKPNNLSGRDTSLRGAHEQEQICLVKENTTDKSFQMLEPSSTVSAVNNRFETHNNSLLQKTDQYRNVLQYDSSIPFSSEKQINQEYPALPGNVEKYHENAQRLVSYPLKSQFDSNVPIQKASGRSVRQKRNEAPLKPCIERTTQRGLQRKRKLYDPDQQYLHLDTK